MYTYSLVQSFVFSRKIRLTDSGAFDRQQPIKERQRVAYRNDGKRLIGSRARKTDELSEQLKDCQPNIDKLIRQGRG